MVSLNRWMSYSQMICVVVVVVGVTRRRWRFEFKTTACRNAINILNPYASRYSNTAQCILAYRNSARQLGDTEIIKIHTAAKYGGATVTATDAEARQKNQRPNERAEKRKENEIYTKSETAKINKTNYVDLMCVWVCARQWLVYGTAFDAGTRLDRTHVVHRSCEFIYFFLFDFLLNLFSFICELFPDCVACDIIRCSVVTHFRFYFFFFVFLDCVRVVLLCARA